MNYNIKITRDEDGEYVAYIPELDCYGDGATIQEAVDDVVAVADDIMLIFRGE